MSLNLFEFVFILSFNLFWFPLNFPIIFFFSPLEEGTILSRGRWLSMGAGSHHVFSSSFQAPTAELILQCGPVCFPRELRKNWNGRTWRRQDQGWCCACWSVCPSAPVLSYSLQTEPPSCSGPHAPPFLRESCPHH